MIYKAYMQYELTLKGIPIGEYWFPIDVVKGDILSLEDRNYVVVNVFDYTIEVE